ncbi:SKA complex subunit 3-like [Ptychodera flava]|uniref:SKA complex subunit 3-like n=1 Tax=Ptychodera flava TaxID=63121 RepID=UPI00396A951D
MSRKGEDFFSHLRSVAVNAEKQSAELKQLLQKPPLQRSSSSVSSELMLREMLKDVKNLTDEAKKKEKEIESSHTAFSDISNASETLHRYYSNHYQQLETFLCKYGYQQPKKKGVKTMTEVTEKPKGMETEEIKENIDINDEENCKPEEDNLTCVTPVRDQETMADQSATPKLENFGLSRTTLEILARLKNHGPSSTAKVNDTKMNDDVTYCISKGFQTKTTSVPGRLDETQIPEEFQNDGILTTPGLWKGGTIAGFVTPKQPKKGPFGRMAMDAVDSPVPPVFATPGVKQIKKSAVEQPSVPPRCDFSSQKTASPAPPILQSHSTTQSQVIHTPSPIQFISNAVNPEDMPEPEPPEITTRIQPMPAPPVLRANKVDYTEMPEMPTLSLNYSRTASTHTASGVSSESQRQNMQRGLPMANQAKPVSTGHHQPGMTSANHYQPCKAATPAVVDLPQGPANHNLPFPPKCIQPVKLEEMGQLNDYLQRLLTLDQMNEIINKINTLIGKNGSGGQFIRKSELPMLELGPHTNSVMLLLVKLHRIHMERKDHTGQSVHFIL